VVNDFEVNLLSLAVVVFINDLSHIRLFHSNLYTNVAVNVILSARQMLISGSSSSILYSDRPFHFITFYNIYICNGRDKLMLSLVPVT